MKIRFRKSGEIVAEFHTSGSFSLPEGFPKELEQTDSDLSSKFIKLLCHLDSLLDPEETEKSFDVKLVEVIELTFEDMLENGISLQLCFEED